MTIRPVPPLGSAIFLHLAQPDWGPTAGCVAVTLEDMLEILRLSARRIRGRDPALAQG